MARANKEVRHPISYRILHEIIIVSIIILILTGFYIHRPFVGGGGVLMYIARGVHTFFAVILILAAVARIIGMFAGRNRDWNSFVPSWSDLKLLPQTFKYYAYLGDEPKLTKKYNPFQMISYCLAFLLVIFQILSGIALKYPVAMSWFNYSIFNNPIVTRMAHFVVMWLFIMFVMIHVYLAIREKFGEIKEMHLLSGDEEK